MVILLNIPINYSADIHIHPMALLPSIASLNTNTSTTSNPADLFTRRLPSNTHRYKARIPLYTTVTPTTTPVATSSGAATSVISASVASTTNRILLDSGASRSITPFKSDFDSGTPTPELLLLLHKRLFGIPRSALDSLLSDPYTLITGEDIAITTASDLSSPD